MTVLSQQATASGNGLVKQVAGNNTEYHVTQYLGPGRLTPVPVADDELRIADHAYVPAPAAVLPEDEPVARAVRALTGSPDGNGIVVLAGDPGTGRRTTALRVLRKAGVPGKRICDLLPDWDTPRAAQIPHGPGDGYVLDLSDYSSLPKDFYRGLAEYRTGTLRSVVRGPAAVREEPGPEPEEARTLLVILVTHGTWNPAEAPAVPRIEPARPPAPEVARAHLRLLSEERREWLEHEKLAGLLDENTAPRDAARLARIIAGCPGDDPGRAAEQYRNWRSTVTTWFRDNAGQAGLRYRALMVAAALLDGAPAPVVLAAAESLYRMDAQAPPGALLAGQDLQTRLDVIEAQRDGDRILLGKARPGIALGVLDHVWRELPEVRELLLDWMAKISESGGIAVRHLDLIADRLTHLAAGLAGETVLDLALTWIGKGGEQHRRLAAGVLGRLATHPRTGAEVRRRLYDWARNKGTPEELCRAVAEVCAGELGRTYPQVALTRLRLLAGRPDGRAAGAVADAVRALAGSSPARREGMLEVAVRWAEDEDPAVRLSGARVFLALVELPGGDAGAPADDSAGNDRHAVARSLLADLAVPAADGREPPERGLLVRGWRAAFGQEPTADPARRALAAWLDTPDLTDEQALVIPEAVLRGRLHQARLAELVLGGDTETGRARRRELLDRLITAPLPAAA
ncbi:hypothetical protein [Streptomyces aidingensis]|uniref:Uncharacterized protein n=1 Tax=Streptomyces aidingensis TaxID=910347 RepID=A0A1I1TN43_9ACTN|nr:hypothetical protein [Streptomyces aidingensis]SFD58618.1 hypothetical protein SAMN05421773_1206 [Streptomyces aidingensis]